jgi:AcrR family transcriptional regulator
MSATGSSAAAKRTKERHRRAGASRARLRGLAPEEVAADQRRRILATVGEAISRRGYMRTAVEDILGPAGVSRRTFYELFAGKADAFCAAHDEALGLLGEQVQIACEGEREWPRKVAAAIAAALRWAAADPVRAHLIAAEPLTAGPNLAYCHDLLLARFGPGLRLGCGETGVELSETGQAALLGGVARVVALRLRAGHAARLPDLAPELTQIVLSPYLGREEAERRRFRKRS